MASNDLLEQCQAWLQELDLKLYGGRESSDSILVYHELEFQRFLKIEIVDDSGSDKFKIDMWIMENEKDPVAYSDNHPRINEINKLMFEVQERGDQIGKWWNSGNVLMHTIYCPINKDDFQHAIRYTIDNMYETSAALRNLILEENIRLLEYIQTWLTEFGLEHDKVDKDETLTTVYHFETHRVIDIEVNEDNSYLRIEMFIDNDGILVLDAQHPNLCDILKALLAANANNQYGAWEWEKNVDLKYCIKLALGSFNDDQLYEYMRYLIEDLEDQTNEIRQLILDN